MTSLKKIIKTSSAVGMFLGAAYYYLNKSIVLTTNANPYHNRLSLAANENMTMHTSNILKFLSLLDDLSNRICNEINLILPKESIRRTFSMTFLKKLNSVSISISFNIQQTFNNLSTCTKNEEFLDRFIFFDGITILKDILSCDDVLTHMSEEVEQTLSELFANLSLKSESMQLNESEVVTDLLSKWSSCGNIVLNLNAMKYNCNISEFRRNNNYQMTIFGPDIFVLDHPKFLSERKDFDVIFINGMLGSVYFTWRQHDDEVDSEESEKTKCWPRDWLSQAIPNSRIIGINALLRPFVWNPMSNIDKMNRSIEDRAEDITNKLELAGVGRRPIVWVTHSAGGILLKHILMLSNDKPLAMATRSILFMSTPHSGAQSMMGLYYFPFKYFLTPEAKHLETNSLKLFELNSWFKEFAKSHNIDILTMTETQPTKINKFYSTVIVPKCDGEFAEGHEEVNVKSDHLYISKPRNKSDQIYRSVLAFVAKTVLREGGLRDDCRRINDR